MINSIPAKPWVVIDPSAWIDTDKPIDRFALMSKLLEKGFPVKFSNGFVDDTNETRQLFVYKSNSTAGLVEAASQSVAIDVTDFDVEQIVTAVEGHFTSTLEGTTPRKWKPWFPVIDYDRCTNCMQCLSFCLFDVYGVTKDKQIKVQNESNCKTDCPACSRVCPEVAIMFPKYKAGPINGDNVSADDVRREGMKVDISALLGGDIYSMLRDRSVKAKSRFSLERDEDRALKERQRCLAKLKAVLGDLDIPAEVLSSLPSRDQIESKAESARQKAADVLASINNNTNPSPEGN